MSDEFGSDFLTIVDDEGKELPVKYDGALSDEIALAVAYDGPHYFDYALVLHFQLPRS